MAGPVGRHLLVTFLVTRDGERGHPMDTIVKRVDLAGDSTPTPATLDRLTESIASEVVRVAAVEDRARAAASNHTRERRPDDHA